MSRHVAAIDFGTTNTTVALRRPDGRVEVLEPERNSVLLPSIVYLDRTGLRQTGTTAIATFGVTGAARTRCLGGCDRVEPDGDDWYTECRHFSRGGGCHDARLLGGLKGVLAQSGVDVTHSWAKDYELPELVSVILLRAKRVAESAAGEPVDQVVVGHPVVFDGASGPGHRRLQELALRRLEAAAHEAGFTKVDLVPEPAAASLDPDLPEGISLITDFGGGTFDVAVAEISEGAVDILELAGIPVGGQDIDAELFRFVARPQLGLEGEYGGLPVPARIKEGMSTLAKAQRLINDPDAALAIYGARSEEGGHALDPAIELLFGGHAHAFYSELENLKITLSSADRARFRFVRPSIQVSATVSREELEVRITHLIEAVRDVAVAACAEQGVEPEAVESILTTGGSSQLPLFRRLLEETFTEARILDHNPFDTVVRGLAEFAEAA